MISALSASTTRGSVPCSTVNLRAQSYQETTHVGHLLEVRRRITRRTQEQVPECSDLGAHARDSLGCDLNVHSGDIPHNRTVFELVRRAQ